ncbi:GH25 family lysozyme [Sphingosinithalassobacter portus]|uniref:GH25 family lysozyme n=1 Tax=Stakelama portus TaxID=2676234 RepID=UPI000D6E49A5|nr:GH25 family lysozyme [Sphingosinithalassobacter portus]
MLRRTALFVLILTILLVTGWVIAADWRPAEADYPSQGIDVSQRQGIIDWEALPDDVDFAYIKATEGNGHIDRRFRSNWADARAAGIKRGAYHRFSLCVPGADQADGFIGTVPADRDMLPPAVELRFEGNCSERPTPDALATELTIFVKRIEARYGRRVLLYLTREFDGGYEVSRRFPDQPLWLRSIALKPDWGRRPWTLWQASSFRRIAGISGPVDWNVAARP